MYTGSALFLWNFWHIKNYIQADLAGNILRFYLRQKISYPVSVLWLLLTSNTILNAWFAWTEAASTKFQRDRCQPINITAKKVTIFNFYRFTVHLDYVKITGSCARCTSLSTHTTTWNTCCHNTAILIKMYLYWLQYNFFYKSVTLARLSVSSLRMVRVDRNV